MVSDLDALDSIINRLEELYDRCCIPTTSRIFIEVFAKFCREIAHNPLFESYRQRIKKKQESYLARPDVASIMKAASFEPAGKQALDQEMLTREERISEYWSLWIILRFDKLYDLSLLEETRNNLKMANNTNEIDEFDQSVNIISSILKEDENPATTIGLKGFYLPYAHHIKCELIHFLKLQKKSLSAREESRYQPNTSHTTTNNSIELKLNRTKRLLIVSKKEIQITTDLQWRYISMFFNRKGLPMRKKIYDDEIHSKVFSNDALIETKKLTKSEKDQVSGLKKHFKDVIAVKERRHSIQSKYLS